MKCEPLNVKGVLISLYSIGRLPRSVFEVSKKMLLESSRNPVAATVEREAGWLLLASLIASMPKKVLVFLVIFHF